MEEGVRYDGKRKTEAKGVGGSGRGFEGSDARGVRW